MIATLLLCVIIFSLIATITVLLGYAESKQAFQKYANSIALQIEQRLYEVDTVSSSLVALHHSATSLNASELGQFSREMIKNYPHIYSIEFVLPVSREERPRFEEEMRDEGYAGFSIRELDSEGNWRRAAERELYLPIVFMEPLRPETTQNLGFDLLSDQRTRKAVLYAIDSGNTGITNPLELVQGGAALIVVRAAYKGRVKPESVEQRRRQLAGLYELLVVPKLLLQNIDTGIDKQEISRFVLRHSRFSASNPKGVLYSEKTGRLPLGAKLLPSLSLSVVMPSLGGKLALDFDKQLSMLNLNLHLILLELLFFAVVYYLLLNTLRQRLHRDLEREKAEDEIFREKERAEVTLHSIADGVITTDVMGKVEYLNELAERITGKTCGEAIGKHVSSLISIIDEGTNLPLACPVSRVLASEKVVKLTRNIVIGRSGGRKFAVDLTVSPIHNRAGKVIGAVMVFHDVSTERNLAREMAYQATHDVLTGLYNRREFEAHIKQSLVRRQGGLSIDTVCYMDLDQFKVVNDTSGHIAGDELLRQLAALLKSRLRESDILARLGGDEFGLLLFDCNVKQAITIAESIRKLVKGFRFYWDEKTFEVGISIGLVEITPEIGSVSDVLKAADSACYLAKDKGRNRVYIFQPDDRELTVRHGEMQWLHRIQRAFEENRFYLVQQKITPLFDPTATSHSEILLRMLDEDGKTVPPMAFIPAAERYDIMYTLDKWVISKSLEIINKNKDDRTVYNINISGQSLCNEMFYKFLVDAVDKMHINPARICFEVTETAAIGNLVSAMKLMLKLKEAGCLFALDDFGSGLSSFAYLRDLPVDFLKIDGAFVRNMVDDTIDAAMVEAINHIGHIMGIRTIAEFVEDDAIIGKLHNLGVDYVQGYGIESPQMWFNAEQAGVS